MAPPAKRKSRAVASRRGPVRHRAGTFLADGEKFFGFEHFGPLEMPELLRPALNGTTDQRQRRRIFRVPVALENLSGNIYRLESELPADICFDLRREMRVSADGTRDFSDRHDFASAFKSRQRPTKLVIHQRHFQTERRRLGVNAMRAPHARCKFKFLRFARDDLPERFYIGDENLHCLHHLVRQRCVADIRRRQTFVNVPGGRADMFGDAGQECDDIVVGGLLDFVDALHGKLCFPFDEREVARRNLPGFAGEDFDLEPNPKFVFVRPNLAHRFSGIASNHSAGRLTNQLRVVNARSSDILRIMNLTELIFLPRPRQLRADRGNCPNSQPRVVVDPQCGLPAQGYRLRLTPSGSEITAGDAAGAFYGQATLTQIRRQCRAELPAGEIADWPDFPVRGVMLDISRDKVPTMETLLALIDSLAEWKINHLELYTEHTFAYRNHRAVWEQASPLTGAEIDQLDAYCRARFIDLVPNQNSLGHFERWLRHPDYHSYSETPDGFTNCWGVHTQHGSTLYPGEPKALELLTELYAELLPHFSSQKFNVGGDEPWELGEGRSKSECERIGKGRVYLDFLLKIHKLVQQHGRTMHFWGDIILHYPELVKEIPEDVVVLEWGYEADHKFDEHGALFAQSGKKFYVCPGTSSWNTITGRTDNCLANLRSAATNGLRHGASGFLNTDWGDNGHWQYLPVSYLGFAAGAAIAWNQAAHQEDDFIAALDTHVFRDAAQVMGRLAHDLGNVYLKPGKIIPNSSALFWLIQREQLEIPPNLAEARDFISATLAPLANARMQRSDATVIHDEFTNAGRLLRYACDRGQSAPAKQLASQLREIISEHRRLWLARNRPGGLPDSCRVLEKRLREAEQT